MAKIVLSFYESERKHFRILRDGASNTNSDSDWEPVSDVDEEMRGNAEGIEVQQSRRNLVLLQKMLYYEI